MASDLTLLTFFIHAIYTCSTSSAGNHSSFYYFNGLKFMLGNMKFLMSFPKKGAEHAKFRAFSSSIKQLQREKDL